eukprot:8466870-Lingulodinium_polyedra.AAC.1
MPSTIPAAVQPPVRCQHRPEERSKGQCSDRASAEPKPKTSPGGVHVPVGPLGPQRGRTCDHDS